jgi:hypothetical protein
MAKVEKKEIKIMQLGNDVELIEMKNLHCDFEIESNNI